MIRSFFGLTENPFSSPDPALLQQQQDIFDTLKVPTATRAASAS